MSVESVAVNAVNAATVEVLAGAADVGLASVCETQDNGVTSRPGNR